MGGKQKRERSAKDVVANTARALIKSVPGIGSGADQLIFGPVDARWQKRIEGMLEDVLERLEGKDAPGLQTDEMYELFESSSASIARATAEDKRARFRDLLVNAAQTPAGDPRWEEARLAREMLEGLEAPAFEILSRTHALEVEHENSLVMVYYDDGLARFGIMPPVFNINKSGWETTIGWKGQTVHDAVLIHEWTKRLAERELVSLDSVRGSGGGLIDKTLTQLALTARGKFLVRWTIADE